MVVELKQNKRERAVLAGLQLPSESDFEHRSSLDELERLVKTLGFLTVGRVSQKRKYPAAGTVLGKGKLRELSFWTGGTGIVQGFKRTSDPDHELEPDDEFEDDHIPVSESFEQYEGEQASIVVFDRELTPTQLRNLEEATGAEVLDRTGVILEIFSRHAKSKEARVQVEIAKLAYMAPRLRLSHLGADRQGGGIGAKGAGESAHELDRRRIRDRISELRSQLKSIQTEQDNRRTLRKEVPLVALIGYTNAGKSSLMRRLTGTDISGEDKLFATLDTTIRAMHPKTTPRILISDTVGFIKKLPHDLVASFRSTLDEARHASLLLFVVDGSDANFKSQYEVTKEVIEEIGAGDHDSRLIVNKADQLTEIDVARIKKEFPQAVLISAFEDADILKLRELILSFFEENMTEEVVHVPYSHGEIIGQIHSRARVVQEKYDEFGSILTVRAPAEVHEWIKKQIDSKT